MIDSTQPARFSIAEPSSVSPSVTPPVRDAAPVSTRESADRPPSRDDPADHPLVKGVMEQFSAKIVEVRRKG